MAVAVIPEAERAAIVATVLDYFEGWFDGDTMRIDRALHPALAKRSLGQVASAGAELRDVTKEQMVTWTAAGEGKAEDRGPGRRIDVTVVDVHGNVASAVVDSDVYREYLHLVRTSDGWKIVNALWHFT
jgi:Putative lumazine-binding